MSSTDVTIHQASAVLTIAPDQSHFTDDQRAILQHMGVEGAPEPDLQVFLHVCQRTGLDPFARQIHMIGRNSKNYQTDQWETKYTIQTGIDGYRVIGHRAADRMRARISMEGAEWCTEDGRWLNAWSKAWGTPIAARVTIRRDGEPFTAVANFDEYAQTKKGGGLTSMWVQRGAGQLAKCAEALAWRMAFPHDLAGIYTTEEMGAANDQRTEPDAPPQPTSTDRLRAAVAPEQPAEDVHDAEVVEDVPEPLITTAQSKALHASLHELGITDRDNGLNYCADVIGHPIDSTKTLTKVEASRVIEAIKADIETPFQDQP